ncbi:hypothetical protein BC833DRAFT_617395 [Globomyces pollinis-pini]|nr:hypothetical protein BC833DRAFT_617395 [Globomyces pollinis-pini]
MPLFDLPNELMEMVVYHLDFLEYQALHQSSRKSRLWKLPTLSWESFSDENTGDLKLESSGRRIVRLSYDDLPTSHDLSIPDLFKLDLKFMNGDRLITLLDRKYYGLTLKLYQAIQYKLTLPQKQTLLLQSINHGFYPLLEKILQENSLDLNKTTNPYNRYNSYRHKDVCDIEYLINVRAMAKETPENNQLKYLSKDDLLCHMLLLQHPDFNPKNYDEIAQRAFQWVGYHDQYDSLKQLLSKTKFIEMDSQHFYWVFQMVLVQSISNDKCEIVQLLLSHELADPSFEEYKCIKYAAKDRKDALLLALLKHPKTDLIDLEEELETWENAESALVKQTLLLI